MSPKRKHLDAVAFMRRARVRLSAELEKPNAAQALAALRERHAHLFTREEDPNERPGARTIVPARGGSGP